MASPRRRIGRGTCRSRDSRSRISRDRLAQIDARDVGDRGEPRQHIGEFLEPLLVRAAAQRCGQLADLFHEPHERPVDAAGRVLLKVHVADQLLKVGQRGRRPRTLVAIRGRHLRAGRHIILRSANRLVHLAPLDRRAGRRLHAQPHHVAANLDDEDLDITVDDKALVFLPR